MATPPEIEMRLKRDRERMKSLLDQYEATKAKIAKKKNRLICFIGILAGTSLAWIALELSKFIGIKGGF